MYVANRFMETGYPLIIEGNFVLGGYMKANEAEMINALIKKYEYQSLTYQVFSEMTHEDFSKLLPTPGDFTVGGEIIKIDTTDFDKVDFENHIETERLFLNTGR